MECRSLERTQVREGDVFILQYQIAEPLLLNDFIELL